MEIREGGLSCVVVYIEAEQSPRDGQHFTDCPHPALPAQASLLSRGLDLCEATICSEIASVRTWVRSALGVQQDITLRVMNKMVTVAKVAAIVEKSGRVHQVEKKAAEEGGVSSGGHSVQEADASVVEGDSMGSVLGKPVSPGAAPSVQAEACDGSCDSAAGVVSGTPDQPRLSAAAGFHAQEGCSAAPVVAAVKRSRRREAAAEKAAGGGDGPRLTDEDSTESTVLLESWSDVDDQTGLQMTCGWMLLLEQNLWPAGCRWKRRRSTRRPISPTLQTLEFCPPDEGVQQGWRGSWSLLSWNMPGRCCGRRAIAQREPAAMATGVVWRDRSRRGPTVVSTGSLNRLSVGVMCGVGPRSQR